MGLFIIQSIIAVWVVSAAFYLLLTGRINKSINVRKNKTK